MFLLEHHREMKAMALLITIFLVFPQVKSTQVFIRDSSMVHPVALICFSGKDVREMHHGM